MHFLLWGALAAIVNGASVTGNYRRTSAPRLVMGFENGEITVWSSSLKFIDDRNVRRVYDFTTDILSDTWDPGAALRRVRSSPASATSARTRVFALKRNLQIYGRSACPSC